MHIPDDYNHIYIETILEGRRGHRVKYKNLVICQLLCGVVVNMFAFDIFGLGSSPGNGTVTIWTSISKSHLVANIIP